MAAQVKAVAVLSAAGLRRLVKRLSAAVGGSDEEAEREIVFSQGY